MGHRRVTVRPARVKTPRAKTRRLLMTPRSPSLTRCRLDPTQQQSHGVEDVADDAAEGDATEEKKNGRET